jgi:hypothetical protein
MFYAAIFFIFLFFIFFFDGMALIQDKNEVQHHISNLLFIGFTCGCLMFLFTKFFGSWALTGNKAWSCIGLFLKLRLINGVFDCFWVVSSSISFTT